MNHRHRYLDIATVVKLLIAVMKLLTAATVEAAHRRCSPRTSPLATSSDESSMYNRALVRQRNSELQADHVDHNERPMLKTPVALERQMVDIYTCSMFENFQDELWESMKYRSTIKVDDEFQTIYEVERQVFDGGKGTQRQNEDGEKAIPDKVRLIVDDKVDLALYKWFTAYVFDGRAKNLIEMFVIYVEYV
ncbi:hypothetical protein L1049_023404 [Liquidambar formosana]|uniref:Uncharacterized protein n=1 Tax=Liquidambar formosana TaxID=63359 RepID=A0AAP0RT11_LIQFO